MRINNGFILAMLGVALLGLAGMATAATPPIYPGELIGAGTLPSGYQMASADLNGDGLPDIVVADDSSTSVSPPAGGVWVFLAQKGGGYAAPVFYATPCNPYTLAIGNLGNGHPDIVAGNDCSSAGNQVTVLIGNGDGTFQPAVNYSPDTTTSFTPESITIGDATGDGKPDVVIGTSVAAAYVIPGNGDGTLDTAKVQKLTLTTGSSYGVDIVDINHDGYPDILAAGGCGSAGSKGTVDVFLGISAGTFSATPSQTLSVGACPEFGVDNDNLIGSTDPDVAVGNYSDGTFQVLTNSSGTLTAGAPVSLPSGACPYWIHVADVDGDGNPDLVMSDPCSDTVDIAYGTNTGGFNAPVFVPAGYGIYDAAAIKNATSGRTDLVGLDNPRNASLVVARNLGSRQFLSYRDYAYQNSSGAGYYAYDMASADFNGDGKPDLVTANNGDGTLSVLLNNGKGGFDVPAVLSLPSGHGTINAVAVGDVNGDGKADIITADSSGHLYVYLGNGDGTFASPITSAIASSTVYGIALGDVDGDGKLDAVVSEFTSNQLQICKGDGKGDFNCSAYAAISVAGPNRVALADLNGDSKLDLTVTSSQADATITGDTDAFVYLGAGNGTFAASPTATLPVVGNSFGIAMGDVNGDGKTDLVFGENGSNLVSVFTGKGDGTFNAPATYVTGSTTTSDPFYVTLGDVNGDGKPDIVVANWNDASISVLTNNGNGTFNPAVTYANGFNPYTIMALDVDGDGLPDIVVANEGGKSLATSAVSVFLHNHAPQVTGTSVTVNENSSATGSVSASNLEQDPLTYAVASQPTHGNVNLNASTGSFTYTPASNYTGSDSFTVTATNGLETSAPATVSVTVNAVSSGGSGGGGGGAFGLLELLALGGLALRRRRA